MFHAKHGPVAVWVGYSGGDPVLLQPEQMILPSPYTIDYSVVRIIIFLSKRYSDGISQVPVHLPPHIDRYRFAIHKILDYPITNSAPLIFTGSAVTSISFVDTAISSSTFFWSRRYLNRPERL